MRNFSVRPSRPLSCRKRRLCQGQARPGRFARLDIRRLASGQKILRAMDGNISGGGSEQKYPWKKNGTKTRPRFVQKSSFLFSRFCPFSDRMLTWLFSPFLPTSPSCVRLFSVHLLPGFVFSPVRVCVPCRWHCCFRPSGLMFCPERVAVLLRAVWCFHLRILVFFPRLLCCVSSPPVIPGKMGTVLHTAPSCQRAGRSLDSQSVRRCASHTPKRQKT